MRIVDLETFRKMPEGLVYSKYTPSYFEGLMIKGATWESDFLYQDLVGNVKNIGDFDLFDKLGQMRMDSNVGFPLDFNCMGRDGLFEEKQLYAIYEKEDIEGLIKRLQEALRDAFEEDANG